MSVAKELALVSLAVAIVVAGVAAQEGLVFSPPADWELGNHQQTRDQMLMEFVKKGDKVETWEELLTVQQFRRNRGAPSTRAFYEAAKDMREKACPGLTEWTVVEESAGSLMYEWKTTGPCEGHPPQSELVKLMFGRNTGYRVAFATRTELTTEARATWLEWLRGVSMK